MIQRAKSAASRAGGGGVILPIGPNIEGRRGSWTWFKLVGGALGLLLAVALGFPSSAAATGGLESGYCKSWQYACVGGGYAATAGSTGNDWAWRYYGLGGTGINTPTGQHNCTLYVAWRLQLNGVPDPKVSWG